ncbi:hypothetical protein OH76DRAFT_1297393, partial [Lentinus brumalis]
LLLKHGAIVSGSVALRYFLPRAVWEPNDLDIYVPEAQYDEFHDLHPTDFNDPIHAPDASNDSVSGDSNSSDLPSSHAGIREVRKFYTPSDRRVDVISVPSNNPVDALKHFWSPLVANFLRPDMAACGSPRTTLDGIGILK